METLLGATLLSKPPVSLFLNPTSVLCASRIFPIAMKNAASGSHLPLFKNNGLYAHFFINTVFISTTNQIILPLESIQT